MFLGYMKLRATVIQSINTLGWLVGCIGFNGPLRQYFSLYRAVSQREGERGERIDESKNVQTTPPAPTASAVGPCPPVIQIVGRPGTGSLPSTIAPPDHPPPPPPPPPPANTLGVKDVHGLCDSESNRCLCVS